MEIEAGEEKQMPHRRSKKHDRVRDDSVFAVLRRRQCKMAA